MKNIITKFTKWILTEGDHACHVEGCHLIDSEPDLGCHIGCHN